MDVKAFANALYASYRAEVAHRGWQMIQDAELKNYLWQMARWATDPCGKCGLMLTGLYGNGKSTLMFALCSLVSYLYASERLDQEMKFRLMEATEIAEMGSDESRVKEFKALINEPLLAIDELGQEAKNIIKYGKVYTPIADLLKERYKRQKVTVVCTNLVEQKHRGGQDEKHQIKDHYGERVVDRLREMMKIIVFTNESYRNRLKPL